MSFGSIQSTISVLRQSQSSIEKRFTVTKDNVKGTTGSIQRVCVDSEGVLCLGTRLYMPDMDDLRKEIMEEAHFSTYSVHPGSTKMYHNLKDTYWWNEVKRDITEFPSNCLTCQ